MTFSSDLKVSNTVSLLAFDEIDTDYRENPYTKARKVTWKFHVA